jgi:hypothetical protein
MSHFEKKFIPNYKSFFNVISFIKLIYLFIYLLFSIFLILQFIFLISINKAQFCNVAHNTQTTYVNRGEWGRELILYLSFNYWLYFLSIICTVFFIVGSFSPTFSAYSPHILHIFSLSLAYYVLAHCSALV